MNASPVLLLLFLLSMCHGENVSPTSGILSTTKAQKKLETSLEVSCPEPTEIEPCECSNQGVLNMDCSKVQDEEQLRKVFSAFFPNTDFHRFYMSYNKGLKVLEDEVFGDVSFRELEIYESVLETVRNDSLTPSRSTLTSIYIDSCELAIFPFERLAEFTSLKFLSLLYNKIPSLPPLSSSSLQTLDLSHNPISHLSPDVFIQLPAVNQILFGGCSLTEITPGTFKDLPHLSSLILFENKVSYLQSLTFDLVSPSPFWAVLNLEGNNITSVEVDAFKGNDLSCGCDVAWLLRDSLLLTVVSDARCADGTLLTDLNPADFDICD